MRSPPFLLQAQATIKGMVVELMQQLTKSFRVAAFRFCNFVTQPKVTHLHFHRKSFAARLNPKRQKCV